MNLRVISFAIIMSGHLQSVGNHAVKSILLPYYYGFRKIVSLILRRLSEPVIRYAFWAIRRMDMKAEMERIAIESGMDLVVRHYYSPIPDPADFGPGFWDEQSDMPGVEINDAEYLKILEQVVPAWLPEFRNRYHVTKPTDEFNGFYLVNGVYMAVDAHVYYALIREFKPAKIVEVGSGMSTLIAADALAENRKEGHPATLTSIEPNPSAYLRAVQGIELIQAKVQDVDLSTFSNLGPNDILFIDSAHVLREGNDVQFEYLELLPRLGDGVLIHIHDVSLPRRYPSVYYDEGGYWNEQYLLQAFLAFNKRFEVIWPGNYVMLAHEGKMTAVFPEIEEMRNVFPNSEPSAFWMSAGHRNAAHKS